MRFYTFIRSDTFNLTCTARAEQKVTFIREKISYSTALSDFDMKTVALFQNLVSFL